MSRISDVPSYMSKQVESSRLFFLESGADDAFSVACGGYERCSPDYAIDRSALPWHCLEFVSRGSGRLTFGGEEHALHPGVFFLYDPSFSHRIESSAENPLGKYFVAFQGHEVKDFLSDNGLVPGMVARCHKGDLIRASFDMMIDRGMRKSRMARPLCSLFVRQLLLLCSDEASAPIRAESASFKLYMKAKAKIEANFMEFTTLEAVGEACNIEPSYLCRLFSRFHDESPYQFLTRLRMDHASTLLLKDGASVKSVAADLGFKDAFHFSRVFKSIHHVPPSRYRL